MESETEVEPVESQIAGSIAEGQDIPDFDEFKPITSADVRAWFKKSPGAVLYGKWLGRFPKTWVKKDDDEGSTHFHQVMVLCPVTAMVQVEKNGSERETVERKLPAGAVVNVDESAALIGMASLPDQNEGRHLVYVKVLKKEAIKGTAKTIWRMEAKFKPLTQREWENVGVPF
jgi:hypothetical protein